jgi:hypothetical protein
MRTSRRFRIKVRVVNGVTEFKGVIDGLNGRRLTRLDEAARPQGFDRHDIAMPQRTSSALPTHSFLGGQD